MTINKKLNIAFFTDTYKPTVNGVVTAVDLFASELRAQGHRVVIFGPRHPKQPKEKDFYGLRSFPLPVAPDFRLSLPVSMKMIKQMPEMDFDVVHCHTYGPMAILSLSYARAKNIPLVHTYHSMISDYAKYYIPRIFWGFRRFCDWWEYFTYNKCDRITAPTPYIKKYLEQVGIKRPVTVLPTGLHLDMFEHPDPKLISDIHLPPGKKIVICVSRMNKEKNLDFVIEAFAVLRRKNPQAFLLMVGGGPYQKKLELLASKLGESDNILFTGMKTRPQIAALLAKGDVFVYTCRNDTQGLVVMEALAAGKPLVLINEEVFEPFVQNGRNGYLLSEDHLLFATKLNEILKNPELQKSMGERSRLLAKDYSIAHSTDRLVSLYHETIAAQPH